MLKLPKINMAPIQEFMSRHVFDEDLGVWVPRPLSIDEQEMDEAEAEADRIAPGWPLPDL